MGVSRKGGTRGEHYSAASLWQAVADGRLRETELMLQCGDEQHHEGQAKGPAPWQRELHRTDKEGNTLLLLAVRSGNPGLVRLLLAHGSQPDVRNRNTGAGPIHEALLLMSRSADGSAGTVGHVQDLLGILEALVEHGAYVGLRDRTVRVPAVPWFDRLLPRWRAGTDS